VEDKVFNADAKDEDRLRESGIRKILFRRRKRFETLRNQISDGVGTAFIIVLAAERLPVLETIELYNQLSESNINIGGLVVNKRMPQGMGEFMDERLRQEEKHLESLEAALGGLPRQDLSLFPHDVVGVDALAKMAEDF
jgi:arsenite-transporting ATPase